MKEQVISENSADDSVDKNRNSENAEKKDSVLDEKYFSFFEYAPISLWIEDFSKVKLYIDGIVKESDSDIKTYLTNNPTIIPKLASLVTIKEVNSAALKLYNAKSKQDLLDNLVKVFTENSNIGFSKLLVEILLGEKETEVETLNRTLDGQEINTLVKFNVIDGSEDTLDNVIVSVEDITAQVKVRTALLNSKKRHKEAYRIINKSPTVVFLCKNEWDFPVEFASENAFNLFGYSQPEFLENIIKIKQLVHPDDLEYIGNEFIKLIKNKSSRTISPNPFRIVTKNNEVKWIQASFDTIINGQEKTTHIQGIAEDITERKRAEELLFESNQHLKDQFNHTPLASIIWDLDYNVIEWNSSAERIFGYTAEEAKEKPIKDLLTPPYLVEEMEKLNENLLIQKASNRNTNENVTKSGKIITCEWYNVILKDAGGNVTGVASLVNDVTERINSKKLLEKSEKKYKDIFEKSVDAVLILKDGFFIDCNESALKMFDYDNKISLLQKHPSKLSPENQLDGGSSYLKAEEMINIALEKGSHRFRWDHQQKNGHVFPAEVSLTKIEDSSDKPILHVVVKDITEIVKNEKLEDVLYNISKTALIINDFKKFSLFVRNELSKIIDTRNFYIAIHNKETDMITTPVFVDEREEVEEFSAKNSLTGYVIKSKKPLILSKDDHIELIKNKQVELIGEFAKIWVGVPLLIQDECIGAIVVQSYENENAYSQNDVQLLEFVADQIGTTIQRKKVENELNSALAKAQESDKLKSSFLANMSHEIRTPMNGIIGFSEFFLEPNLSETNRKKYAEIIINSSKQLLSIVNDILDISKIEAGEVKLNYESVNINKLLDEIYAFYKPKSLESNLKLTCVKGIENYKSTIEIDKIKLNQVLTNLLSNAFKFTDNGGIEFGYQIIEDKMQFYVKDTGSGIEEKLQPTIFDRFTQANLDFKKQHKGTGLGLAISKKFIELFKGEIWLTSNNNGTIIYFTIPYIKGKTPLISTVIEERKTVSQVKNKELTVLVAEDEEYNRMYINELFSKTNFKIMEAVNGLEAIELVKKHPEIDLVLMDIKMPVMDGYEALKEIKKEHRYLPIIALSAFAMESDKKAALSRGFDAYLTKPIDKKLLFNLIGKYSD